MSLLKPLKFSSNLPERRDPNYEAFVDKIKHMTKRELQHSLFLAIEALVLKDEQIAVATGQPLPEIPDGQI
jgi:uncharacterized protein YjaG (DUF416 family)